MATYYEMRKHSARVSMRVSDVGIRTQFQGMGTLANTEQKDQTDGETNSESEAESDH